MTLRTSLAEDFNFSPEQIDEIATNVCVDAETPSLLLEQPVRGGFNGLPHVHAVNAAREWKTSLRDLSRARPEKVARYEAAAKAKRDAFVRTLLAAGCAAR